jgi:tellurite resistance protein
MRKRLSAVPTSFFGIVLGLIALGDCWRAAHFAWGTTTVIPDIIMIAAVMVWAVLMILFVAKWVLAREEALAEFRHPVQSSFIALVSVSTLLIAYLADEKSHGLAVAIFAVSLTAELAFAAHFTTRLRHGDLDATTLTPAAYLPTVAANLVASFAAAFLGFHTLAVLLFGIGVLCWLMLESQIGFRLAYSPTLPPAQRATIGILVAPPAVACMAYLFITGGPKGALPDTLALALIGYGLFSLLVIVRDLRWLFTQPFNASYWAFSFGIGALAFDIVLARARGMGGFFDWLSVAAMVVANLVIGVLIVGTVWQLVTGRLLPPREPAQKLA